MVEEAKSVEFDINSERIHIGVDLDKDGEKSLTLDLKLSEAIQEAFKKGEVVEGARVLEFRFELTKMFLKVDTDRDGEPALELEINLAEAFEEIKSKF